MWEKEGTINVQVKVFGKHWSGSEGKRTVGLLQNSRLFTLGKRRLGQALKFELVVNRFNSHF